MSVNFERAQAIFLDAVELADSSERDRFLHEACGADQPLRNHLEILLNAHGRTGSFLEKGALAIDPTIDLPITEKPGTQIGPFKLLQKIGEGGMGVVYMAEQKKPVKRRVALKIIKPGMDTQQVVARFEAERQALAMMDHPNIAKVLDAGQTVSGRPYFVMELVKGSSLNEYCDKHQLTTLQRLQLFVDVCHAVHHAHQKGVIHRDIKPSNVMVTVHDGKPVPKVIDFGVVKAIGQQMTERTLFTEYGQIVGTPTYMSPEQADDSGDEVETRSDVYSLGVLLYELLTGSTPIETKRLRSAGYAEMLRIIREEEPPRPSARVTTLNDESNVAGDRGTDVKRLGSLLKHDLDWIVMKAIEKDRTRRYDSASHFAEDIGRYIDGAEVRARPRSTIYSVSKFCQRHKPLVASTAVITIALLAVTTLSILLYLAEHNEGLAKTREIDRYEAASNDAETAAVALERLLAYDVKSWGVNDKRTRLTREKLATALSDSGRLDEAIEHYKELFEACPATGDTAETEKQRIAKKLNYALVLRSIELSEPPGAKRKDLRTATILAEWALRVAETHFVGGIDRSYCALMMAAYRKGEYVEADILAKESLRSRGRGYRYETLLTLAAINGKNGQLGLAKDWYGHAMSAWSAFRTTADKDTYEPFREEVAGVIFRADEAIPRGTVTVEERKSSLSRRISAHPQSQGLYRARGYCWILLGQWKKAKADFATGDSLAKENGDNHSYFDVCHAWTLFHFGEGREFDRIRLHQIGELVNDRLAWPLEKRETSVLYLSQPGKIPPDVASLFNNSQHRTVRAFAAYRDSRFEEAIIHCEAQMGELERSSSQCKHALAQLILAMAYHQSSLVSDAKKELKFARQMLIDHCPRPGHPRESNQVGYLTSVGWLEPLAILREAERLIDGELSEFSKELRSLLTEAGAKR